MIEARDKRMGLDTSEARRERADLASLARPQGGVDAMKDQFANAQGSTPGVTDNGDASTRPVPHIMMQPPGTAAPASKKR